MNYKDFLPNNSYTNFNDGNKKLLDELNKYRKENEELKNKIAILSNENIKLNKILSNFNSNNKQNNNVKTLNEIIKNKDIEINNLLKKLQNKNNINVKYSDIIYIHFISSDKKIDCHIKCLKTDRFAEVEEQLYEKYEEYRETNNNFIRNGELILRFKKICENNIQDGDEIQFVNW